MENNNAFAGSRTRVHCLEGNYPNRWTTNASCCGILSAQIYNQLIKQTPLTLFLGKYFDSNTCVRIIVLNNIENRLYTLL